MYFKTWTFNYIIVHISFSYFTQVLMKQLKVMHSLLLNVVLIPTQTLIKEILNLEIRVFIKRTEPATITGLSP